MRRMVTMCAVRGSWVVALCGNAAAAGAAWALPPATLSVPYKSGNVINGVGQVNSPFFGGANGGAGFRGMAINNAAAHYVHSGVFVSAGFNQAILDSVGGLGVPYLAAGIENPLPGSVSVPSADYVLDAVYSTAMNNLGNGAFIVRLRAGEFASVTPTSGVYFNKTAMPIREGDAVTAAGVAAGTTWAPFAGASAVHINDSNTLLIGSQIVENAATINALIKVNLDSAGAVTGQTLVAKVSGPVGSGPDTWASLAIGPHTFAMNNSGQVVFSGVTAAGVEGVFLNGAFVARRDQAGPVANTLWGALAGSPVDINASGQWAIRAQLNGTADSVWTEVGDAGEAFSGFFSYTANGVTGIGYTRQVSGSLSTDHDVDLYYVRVGDPAQATQEAFSATTVPDTGAGFAGAAFDSVLYLFRDFHNANGAFRTGLGRCDNAATSVMQSTLGTASLPNDHVPGTGYFLAISTPKARALAGFSSTSQMWQDDPGSLAIVGGVLHWVDPSEGQIRRIDLASAAELAPLQVGVIPPQTVGQVVEDAPLLAPMLAAYDAGAASKLYFIERRYAATRLKRCNLDGSNVEVVRAPGATPSISGANAIAIDSTNGWFYWSQPFTNGPIHRCDLDGNNAQTILTLDSTRASSMAVDPVSGKLYYHEPVANSLNRCNLDGTSPQLVAFPLNVSAMAADVVGRRLYLGLNTGLIRRRNLDTNVFEADFLTSNRTGVMTVDGAGGNLYWSNSADRAVRRAAVAGGPVQDWASVGADVGERPSEGPGYLDSYNSFAKNGTAGGGPLPYQIKLTGVTGAYPLTVIARNGVKVVGTGDTLPSTGPDGVTTVGGLTSPVKISDNGFVAWRGRWLSTVAPTGLRTALFMNNEEAYRDNTSVAGAIGGVAGTQVGSQYGFDMSTSGQHLACFTTNGSFSGAGDNCVIVNFASVPAAPCRADFNGSGAVTVQDIFDFLAAYFSSAPSADINNSGSVTVQDIFDYLALYFAGCS